MLAEREKIFLSRITVLIFDLVLLQEALVVMESLSCLFHRENL